MKSFRVNDTLSLHAVYSFANVCLLVQPPFAPARPRARQSSRLICSDLPVRKERGCGPARSAVVAAGTNVERAAGWARLTGLRT
jgi:hypothetical protein